MACRELPIGFANPGDAQSLALMSRDLIESGLGWEYRRDRIARMIAADDHVALVTRDGPRVAGFAVMSFRDDTAHLVLLAVRPGYQRRGIARSMLNWLLETATIAGVASMHVELRESNAAAYGLYRGCGFVETLRVPRYYRGRETAVRMMRLFRAPHAPLPVWRPPTMDRR